MPVLKELEGKDVYALIPANSTEAEMVRLVSVEDAGIWIQSQRFTNAFLASVKKTMADRTLVLFVPWPKVEYILWAINVPSISDSALS